MNLLFVLIVLIAFVAMYFDRSLSETGAEKRERSHRAERERISAPQISSEVAVLTDHNPVPATASGFAAFDAFDGWVSEFFAAPPEKREVHLKFGVRLAEVRRSEMKRLIAEDPRAALIRAIPRARRVLLPAEVRAHLEEYISAEGRVTALVPLPRNKDDRAKVMYTVDVGDRMLRAHTYGRRGEALRKNHSHSWYYAGWHARDQRNANASSGSW